MNYPNQNQQTSLHDGILDAALAGAFKREDSESSDTPDKEELALAPNKEDTLIHGGPAKLPTVAIEGYEILRRLGRGGMGIVYLARQIELKRLVAVKMILAGAQAEEKAKSRFRREAEAVARLQHPGIVQIYDIGEQDGCPYFTLEYVAGGSLADRLDGTPWPARRSAEWVERLATIVHAAHQHNIIHRDIKPENVLLASRIVSVSNSNTVSTEQSSPQLDRFDIPLEECTPKLTDFGLAKLLDDQQHKTETGAVLGTPSYMAPELARTSGAKIGPVTDIYSLGAVLYELLTGRPPFKAESAMETLFQAVSAEPVPPSRFQPKLPLDLETICLKCLEKEPGKRYADSQALANDLRCYLDGKPITARPIGPIERLWRWRRRQPRIAALLAGVFALLLGIFVLALVYAFEKSNAAFHAQKLADEKKQEADRANKEKKSAEQNAADARRAAEQLYAEKGMRLAGDGRLFDALHWFVKPLRAKIGKIEMEKQHRLRFAAYWRYSGRPRLRHILVHPRGVQRAFFSPDGSRAIAIQELLSEVQVWDAATGARIGSLPDGHGLVGQFAISADGRLALIRPNRNTTKSVQLWDIIKGGPVGNPLRHASWVIGGAISPDGNWIATVLSPDTVQLWDARKGERVGAAIKHTGKGAGPFVAFSPGGKHVSVRYGDKLPRIWEVPSGKLLHTFPEHKHPVFRLGFHPKGHRVILANGLAAQIWHAQETKKIGKALTHANAVLAAAFSPDNVHAATASADNTAQVWDAETGRRVGDSLRHKSQVHDVAFSYPDGRYVITAGDDMKARVWAAASGKPVTPFLQHQEPVYSVAFSRDGRSFLTAGHDKTVRIWTMPTQPEAPVLPHSHPVSFLEFSPGGKNLLAAGRDGIAVLNLHKMEKLFPPLEDINVHSARFNSDGSRFVIANAAITRVYSTATGKPIAPPLEHVQGTARAVLSPHGRYVMTISEDHIVHLYEVASRRLIGGRLGNGQRVRIRFFSDDERFAIISAGQAVHVWDIEKRKPAGPPLQYMINVSNGSLSKGGRRLAIADWDNTVWIWDVAAGKRIAGPLVHGDKINSIEFSGDDRRLLTASTDYTARVWDAETGKPLTRSWRHNGEDVIAAFGPHGERVVTASMDGIARIWDVQSGQALTPPLAHGSHVWLARFSPDGNHIVTATEDGKIRLYDVTADRRPVAELVRLTEMLHGYRLDELDALAPITPQQQIQALQGLRLMGGF